jgi:hypothetical protein
LLLNIKNTRDFFGKKLLALAAAGLIVSYGTTAKAEDDVTRDSIFISPYTKHYSYNPEHRHVWVVGYQQQFSNNALRGVAVFSNSFGQESFYIFPWGGRYDDVLGVNGLFAKWTAGLLYGYKAPFENKVPLNYKGFSPAIIPSLGYQITKQWSVEVMVLGTAGVTLGGSYHFK